MKNRSPQLTRQTMLILSILVENREQPIAGSVIASTSGLASGTLYPILIRLEEAGWIKSDWEDEGSAQDAKPRRRVYRVTGQGVKQARAEANAWKPLVERFV